MASNLKLREYSFAPTNKCVAKQFREMPPTHCQLGCSQFLKRRNKYTYSSEYNTYFCFLKKSLIQYIIKTTIFPCKREYNPFWHTKGKHDAQRCNIAHLPSGQSYEYILLPPFLIISCFNFSLEYNNIFLHKISILLKYSKSQF